MEDLNEILATSRRNNIKAGVTGALMFNSGYFVQILEGAAATIEATFERIQMDGRHGDVTLIEFAVAPARIFDQWSMGFVGAKDAPGLRSVGLETEFDPTAFDTNALLARLKDILSRSASAAVPS